MSEQDNVAVVRHAYENFKGGNIGGILDSLTDEHWSVEVRRNGENLVTIETNCLSGKPEFSEAEANTIRSP